MIHLSVNVNKVATLRNSRGGSVPSVLQAVDVCIAAGAPGITVHPRADARHITSADVRDIAARLASLGGAVEYNIEGDPRPDLIAIVREVHPDQCTLVPVVPGEITSQAGWRIERPQPALEDAIETLQADGIRVSVFVDAELPAITWAAGLGADRIELYTEPYAREFAQGEPHRSAALDRFARAAAHAHALGLGVNAGHDLDLHNLPAFARIPHVDEVSIGHALMSHALLVGLDRAVREYLAVLADADRGSAGT